MADLGVGAGFSLQVIDQKPADKSETVPMLDVYPIPKTVLQNDYHRRNMKKVQQTRQESEVGNREIPKHFKKLADVLPEIKPVLDSILQAGSGDGGDSSTVPGGHRPTPHSRLRPFHRIDQKQ